MKGCPPNHYVRRLSASSHICCPRKLPYRGFVITSSPSGLWWRATDGFGTIYACPMPSDGEDHRWDPHFATIKDAKMGIDWLISWQVSHRLAYDERMRARSA